MNPSAALHANRAAIRHVVESHRARNARVFGSVLHGDDTDESDLDILVDPTPQTTLLDVATIQVELQLLLGVTVDVLTPRAADYLGHILKAIERIDRYTVNFDERAFLNDDWCKTP